MTADEADADLSFLAPAGRLADWRMVLAYEAAAQAGILDALPGTLPDLAARCAVDEAGLRPVLGQLAAWGIVVEDGDRYLTGPRAPAPPGDAMLLTHAAAIHRWAALLGPRLRDRTAGSAELPIRPTTPRTGPDLLAINARRLSGPLIDACLARFPHARRVLDLGGGHGVHCMELARRGLLPTLQDRADVVAIAEERNRLSRDGIELFPGDFFHTLPPGPFDLVLCGAVTNMFDGPANRDLYRRLRPIIVPGGGVAIVSYMRGRDEVAASFGLQMLAWTDGGDAHSAQDYHRWLADTGYGATTLHDLHDPPQTLVLAQR